MAGRLQDCVQEVLDPSQPLEHLPALDGITLEHTRQLLASVSFVEAAWSSVHAHAHVLKELKEPPTVQQVSAMRVL